MSESDSVIAKSKPILFKYLCRNSGIGHRETSFPKQASLFKKFIYTWQHESKWKLLHPFNNMDQIVLA